MEEWGEGRGDVSTRCWNLRVYEGSSERLMGGDSERFVDGVEGGFLGFSSLARVNGGCRTIGGKTCGRVVWVRMWVWVWVWGVKSREEKVGVGRVVKKNLKKKKGDGVGELYLVQSNQRPVPIC